MKSGPLVHDDAGKLTLNCTVVVAGLCFTLTTALVNHSTSESPSTLIIPDWVTVAPATLPATTDPADLLSGAVLCAAPVPGTYAGWESGQMPISAVSAAPA